MNETDNTESFVEEHIDEVLDESFEEIEEFSAIVFKKKETREKCQ